MLGQHCKPPWADFTTELEREESLELAVRPPDRDMISMGDYTPKHGDPAVNGLGHEVMDYAGQTFVLKPRQQYMTLSGAHKFKVGQKTLVADNSEKGIEAGQMNTMHANLAGSISRAGRSTPLPLRGRRST